MIEKGVVEPSSYLARPFEIKIIKNTKQLQWSDITTAQNSDDFIFTYCCFDYLTQVKCLYSVRKKTKERVKVGLWCGDTRLGHVGTDLRKLEAGLLASAEHGVNGLLGKCGHGGWKHGGNPVKIQGQKYEIWLFCQSFCFGARGEKIQAN